MQHSKSIACIVLSFMVLPIFVSCDVDNSDEFTDNYSYQLQRQAMIKTDTTRRPAGSDSTRVIPTFSVESGQNTVFTYKHNHIAPDGIADAGLSETLVFQVPDDTKTFEYRGDTLTKAMALYQRSCFCSFSGEAFKATSGFIRGEKLSAVHWIIHAEVNIKVHEANVRITFEEPFYAE